MGRWIMAQKRVSRTERSSADSAPTDVKRTGEGRNLREVDRLIDEIDAVLEENAAEFVRSYVQRGGE
jgi:ubiquitin-like protein Pup